MYGEATACQILGSALGRKRQKVNGRLVASATSSGGRWRSSNGIKWWNEGRVPEEALSGMHCAYSGSLRYLTPRGKTHFQLPFTA